MALKRLRTGEMVQLSTPWVTEGSPARQAILATPEIAALLPRIEAAHKALHDAQPVTDDSRLARIQEKATSLDLRHDEIVRGGYWFLMALAWLSGDGETGAQLVRLRDTLFPEGLDAVQKPYREEAGAAEMLKSRLAADPGAKKALKEIPALKKNLGAYIDELIAVGKKIGENEDERAQLLAVTGPSDAGKLLTARNQWIRAVNALVANAELAGIDEAADRAIFGALRLADKNAERRKTSLQDATEPVAPPPDAAAPAPVAPPIR